MDLSDRARETIKSADIIICENPKHSLKLLNNLGIKKKLIALHDHNEKLVIDKIKSDMQSNSIILISDAGSPLISDPGYKLVRYFIENNINITTVPGPNSIIPALQMSGFPINEFFYAGYFPKSEKQMLSFVSKLNNIDQTIVFLVSRHKIDRCLEILYLKLMKRLICVCKEMTKINEKIYRGSSLEVREELSSFKNNLKGEFVVVINQSIKEKSEFLGLEKYEKEIIKLLEKFSLTDVVEIVHKLSGKTKNKIYKWVLHIKSSHN